MRERKTGSRSGSATGIILKETGRSENGSRPEEDREPAARLDRPHAALLDESIALLDAQDRRIEDRVDAGVEAHAEAAVPELRKEIVEPRRGRDREARR